MMLKQMALVLVVDEASGVEIFDYLEQNSVRGEKAYRGIEADLNEHRAYVDGLEVALTATEFDLLTALIDKQGRILTYIEALDVVWGDHYHVSNKQVSNCASRLNRKLGGNRIENVRACGYRLI